MEIIEQIKDLSSAIKMAQTLKENQLIKIIDICNNLYYNKGESPISDEIYDLLVEKLKLIDNNAKPLKQVGAPVKGKKMLLPFWMGSMDKIKTDQKQLDKWVKTNKGAYLISDKMDGISCLLVIKNGEMKLYTRGDGSYGQDITHLISYINTSSALIPKNKNIALRGELIMSLSNFVKYKNIMSNARNTVAGIVNSKKDKLNIKYAKDIDLITYEIIEPVLSPSRQMEKLKKWGTLCVYNDKYNDINFDILDSILNKRKKKSIYEIDGLIITNDKIHSRNVSGNPSYSFAYKGLTQTANVKVIEVLWTPSKDGVLVPRIHFEKVRLSQADLEYATGFNARFIKDNKIGKGAIITVIRSGDVIPYVLSVVEPSKYELLPKHLEYKWDVNNVNILISDAHKNEIVIATRITKFLRAIGVESVSDGIVKKLVTNNYNTIFKIIQMTPDDFMEIEGFKKKLSEKIYNNIQEKINNIDTVMLMNASNIFGKGFGEKKLKKILNVYPNIVRDYKKIDIEKWQTNLLDIEGLDTITVNHFLKYLSEFIIFYKKISKYIKIHKYVNSAKTNGKFKNQLIVFTGFRNRDWQSLIEIEGGKVSTSVSKNTTLVVYNDGEESSAKYIKATQLGLKTISKSKFAKLHNFH